MCAPTSLLHISFSGHNTCGRDWTTVRLPPAHTPSMSCGCPPKAASTAFDASATASSSSCWVLGLEFRTSTFGPSVRENDPFQTIERQTIWLVRTGIGLGGRSFMACDATARRLWCRRRTALKQVQSSSRRQDARRTQLVYMSGLRLGLMSHA